VELPFADAALMDVPVRVTFVVASADLSGGCKVVAIHARLLRERGHEVLVVAPAPWQPSLRDRVRGLVRGEPAPAPAPERSHFELQGVPLHRLEVHRPVETRDVPDADVIVATWWETAVWVAAMPPRKGAKAYFVQGWERWVDGQPGDEVDATWRLPLHKVAVSRFLGDKIRELAPGADVSLVANAIDPAHFDAPPRAKRSAPAIGLVYSPAHCKGPEVLRAAVEQVRAQRPGVRVVAFGSEPERPHCPLPRGVELELRPAQERIPALYASADVWISASRVEGFGLPALEAMACRTPLVSTRYGGPMDFVRPGVNGFLVDVDDADGLAARALDVLALDGAAWSRMSEAAHRTAHAYTWRDASVLFEGALARARGASASARQPLLRLTPEH
jgi:glycosyltransferase involved in cell wall biosynthesis